MTRSAANVVRAIKTAVPGDASSLNDRELLQRFVEEGNQEAFAALVRRHSDLVLGACRRALPSAQDAEDVCQATFLVLAQKADTQHWQPSIAGWLYATARKVAGNARQSAQRRARREGRAAVPEAVEPVDQVTGRELLTALDEELDRLPPRYREPLVLCYLEGLSREEVAARLGVKASTVKTQLERGRKKLSNALTRRGCGLGLGLLTLAVSSPARASLPRLVEAVLSAVSGSPPAAVAALARGSTVNALLLKQELLLVALTTAAAVGICLGALHLPAASRQAEKAPADKGATTAEAPAADEGKTKEAAKDAKKSVTYAGRVVGPDGQPVSGASVYYTRHYDKAKSAPKANAVTDAAGRFRFTAPAAGKADGTVTSLYATAEGFGPAWMLTEAKPWWRWPREVDKEGAFTLRLAKDDVPVTGRIVNLEGKPVAGVTITVTGIKSPPGGSLTSWLEAIKKRPNADGIHLDYQYLPGFFADGLYKLFAPITTGADGRFTIRGVGRERAVSLLIQGPTIETKEINVLTRQGLPTLSLPWYRIAPELGSLIYYAARFDHPAAPCRPVSGVVRDKRSGKPLAGATVRAERSVGNPNHYIQTTTDRAGRYRLTGLPSGSGQRGLDTLVALPPEGQAYLSLRKRIVDASRTEPATLDFDLPGGVWIEGRVVDKATGEGVESTLGYSIFQDERPEVEVGSLYLTEYLRTDRQGRFRFVGVPVRGLLGARAQGEKVDHFRTGIGADKIEGKSVHGKIVMFLTLPNYVMSVNLDTLVEVKPAKGADKVTCELVLDPGNTQRVRVLDPDGQPLAGAMVAGRFARESFTGPLNEAECTVPGLTAGEPRFLVFQHEGKKLAAALELKGTEKGTVDVKLQSSATLTGRLLDPDGRPLRHTEMKLYYSYEGDPTLLRTHFPGNVVTDAEGRFRIAGLVGGVRYRSDVRLAGKMFAATAFDNLSLKAGEVRDLGDVKAKAMTE
jgi:RNA polymerase sigma factor (sigma-70 family)